MAEIADVKIEESWKEVLQQEFSAPYFIELKNFLVEEKNQHIVYPPGNKIFAAFENTHFDKVKVVIVGQDPYHGPNQANGLAFSVTSGQRVPPSLQNIFKEIRSDLNAEMGNNGDLTPWANQGVLLLNTTLTVRAGSPGSHAGKGWEQFTDNVIRLLSEKSTGLIFLLWGKPAQQKEKIIDLNKHYVLKAPHPSPLSVYRGFFGCKHFSNTNNILINLGRKPIHWNLP